MSRILCLMLLSCCLSVPSLGAAKAHLVSLGKPTTARWLVGPDEDQPLELKVRPLYVDGHVKEHTVGGIHEITDRLFAVRRAFRLNDSLPDDKAAQPAWRWQRGGWLLVDRASGHISSIYLPEFDTYSSVAGWYRDYVAYCGVSDDGEKLFHVVMQLGRRKPVLRRIAGRAAPAEMPDSGCAAPTWSRQPARVTFQTTGEADATYQVRGHAVDLVRDEPEDDAGSE